MPTTPQQHGDRSAGVPGAMPTPHNHIVPIKVYLAVFAALIILLAITIGVAFLHLGPFNVAAALFIAVVKATLVVLFFMHVKYSSRLTWIFAAGGLLWLVIMIILMMSDYLNR